MKQCSYILLIMLLSSFMASCHGRRERRDSKKKNAPDNTIIISNKSDKEGSSFESVSPVQPFDIPILEANQPSKLLTRIGYTLSYNSETLSANWVAWHLTREHTDGPYKRKGLPYLVDEDVSPRQELEDWEETEGYDHGHMCPAGDMKWNREAMSETFLLSNICVQNSRLNQETWERLESTCREWAKYFGEIDIVTGPIYRKHPIKKVGINKNLPVPDAFYKVVLCLAGEPKAIGFIYENIEPVGKEGIEDHVVSVDEIEKITKIDFFSTLDDDVEKEIEANSDIQQWKIYK